MNTMNTMTTHAIIEPRTHDSACNAPVGDLAPGRVLALVGIVPAGRLDAAGLVGFAPTDRAMIRTHAGLDALVLDIAAADITGPVGERNLADIAFLAPRVQRHDALLMHARASGAPVLPCRFATLFASFESLDARLAHIAPRVLSFLGDIAGRDEWGLKVVVDRPAALARCHAELAERAGLSIASAGARYLMERKLRQQAEESVASWIEDRAADVLASVSPFCTGTHVGKVTASSATRDDGRVVVANFALLVDRDHGSSALRARTTELAAAIGAHGVALELSGPWPVYSFVPSPDAD
jgi:hypothetical protein